MQTSPVAKCPKLHVSCATKCSLPSIARAVDQGPEEAGGCAQRILEAKHGAGKVDEGLLCRYGSISFAPNLPKPIDTQF